MESNTLTRGHEFLDKIRRMKRWQKIVTALACAIVFITTYALILPAITLTGDTKVLDCNVSVHEHSDSCYDEDRNIECGYADFVVHEHDENCYNEKGNLVCELPEIKEHKHTDSCYKTKEVLICELEEGTEHEHTDACYEKQEILVCDNPAVLHKHSDKCYKHDEDGNVVKKNGEPVIICDKIEVKKHQHDEDCFKIVEMDEEEIEEAVKAAEERLDTDAETGTTEAIEELIDEIPVDKVKSEPAEDGAVAVVSGDLPKDIEVSIERLELQEEDIYTYFNEEKAEKIGDYAAYDINITSDGEKWQPSGDQDVDVTIENPDIEVKDGQQFVLADIAENNTISDVPAKMEESGDVTFDVQEDSTYLLYTFTVDFHYGDLTFSIAGLDDILISELFEMLKIDRVASDVVNVTFSDPELIKVRQLVEDQDWQLISLKPFDTEETLTIEFNDGEIIVINVTDATTGTGLTANTDSFSKNRYYLPTDITLENDISMSSGNVTLDLNGHKLNMNGHTINVSGGTLNVVDDIQSGSDIGAEIENGNLCGNVASYNNGTLTYYVTETVVIDQATGKTAEKLVKHTVTGKGMIVGNNNNNDKRAFKVTGGTLNLNGGYICNFNASNIRDGGNGGAIYASGGTINQNNAVIAANRASDGGAIYVSNAVLNIKGGVISGNDAIWTSQHTDSYGYGGGGVYSGPGATVNMSGGYVTNNVCSNPNKGACNGGGGFMIDGSTLNFSGGYITGNNGPGGGGIMTRRRSNYNDGGKIYMTGGFITANEALKKEGGGVSVDGYGYMNLTGGYITNNKCGSQKNDFGDWGGGGIFISDAEAVLYIENVLVTENHAGGFGGGIAGCSTGRLNIAVGNVSANFNNTAEGEHLSGSGNAKNEDHAYAKDNPIFMNNGFQDYYCALSSVVSGGMLGGGTAMWTGSMDGEAVSSNSSTDMLYAASVMGLTANPSEADKNKAYGAAKVFVNGNSSPTHGGGILVNGYLSIGPKEIESFCRLEIYDTKSLVNTSGNSVNFNGRTFNFVVEDEYGKIVTRGHNDGSDIIFDDRLGFEHAGTFTYYIYEETSDVPGVVSDGVKYKMEVTIVREDQTLQVSSTERFVKHLYRFSNVKTTNMNTGAVVYNKSPGNDEKHAVKLDPTANNAFINTETDTINVGVEKVWKGNQSHDTEITVQLLRNGEVRDEQKLSSSNSWKYTWTKLSTKRSNGTAYVYTVREKSVSGYLPSYETTTNKEGTTVTQIEKITNTPVDQIDFSLVVKKVDEKTNARLLPNAEFELRKNGEPLHFTYNEVTNRYTYTTDKTKPVTLVTENTGYIYMDKIPGGTYTLVETHAPSGFGTAEPIEIHLDETTNGRILNVTVEDPEVSYVLPESGGIGTTIFYVFGGILVIGAGLILVTRRRAKNSDF